MFAQMRHILKHFEINEKTHVMNPPIDNFNRKKVGVTEKKKTFKKSVASLPVATSEDMEEEEEDAVGYK